MRVTVVAWLAGCVDAVGKGAGKLLAPRAWVAALRLAPPLQRLSSMHKIAPRGTRADDETALLGGDIDACHFVCLVLLCASLLACLGRFLCVWTVRRV